ncbi:MAG TPA: Hsp70 family protein [Trebonia sp.]|nr:Hsp70 family protein [Trebonia sp.]
MATGPWQRADQLLHEAVTAMPAGEDAYRARLMLEQQLGKLAEPLRIALAGKVSSGKSTLVNALVGAPVAVTGRGPVTLAVTVLGYAQTPSWTIHYAGGATENVSGLADLAAFTVRSADGAPAAPVDYVQVLGQYPGLRQYELVDTPGFDSPHGPDTDNALRAIGATHASVLEASVARLRSADAIIAVLQHAVSGPDADVLRRFHSADGEAFTPTPLTAMAVLTKAEGYWPEADDPIAVGQRHARRIMSDERTRRVFHRVVPVCGKVAEAAVLLTDEDIADLQELAADPMTGRRVRNAVAFVRDDGLPLTPQRRQRLLGMLDRYGVWLACQLIGGEGVTGTAELKRLLDERSGMPVLRGELTDRFAAHSGLIKVARAVQVARAVPGQLPASSSDRDRDVVARAVETITSLADTDPSFAEFEVLRRHYAGELDVDDLARAELETAAGERGTTVAARLGLPATSQAADLERAALDRVRQWSGPLPDLGPDGRVLARVMKRRYEELYVRARQAQAVLGAVAQFDDDHPAGPASALAQARSPRAAWPPAGGQRHPGQDEPVLVVDLGTTTSAAILLDGRRTYVGEPSGELLWPTSVCEREGRLLVGSAAEASRRLDPLAFCTEFKPDIGSAVPVMHGAGRSYTAEDLAAEVLRVLREEAMAVQDNAPFLAGGSPRRLLVTVPAQADGRRRDAMIRAGLRAGFSDVELLPEPVAAAFSAGGTPWPPGSVVLVYDLGGGTFDAALVEIGAESHAVIGTAGLADGHGGRDIDAAVFRVIRDAAEAWLAAAPGREAERDEIMSDTLAAAVSLKQGLTAADPAFDRVAPGARVEMNRAQLAALTEGLLRGTVSCCLKLMSDHQYRPADVAGVLLVGGSTRMPAVLRYVTRHLVVAGPPRRHPNPVLAVVEGAANWAEGSASRRAYDVPSSTLRVPLSWTLPGGRGTLVRWLASQDDAYPSGAPLARVRLHDNRLYDLHARAAGRIRQQHAWPGTQVYSGMPLVTSLRTAQSPDITGEPVMSAHWPAAATAIALSPDGRRLAAVLEHPPGLAVFDTVTGRRLAECQGDDRISSLAWTYGSGPALGASSGDGASHQVRVLDDPSAASLRLLSAQAAAVLDLAYLPGGREVVVLGGDGTLRIVDAASGKTMQELPIPGHPEILAVSGDGRRIATGGGDRVQGLAHVLERAPAIADGWEVVLSPRLPPRVRAMSFSGNWLLVAGGGEDEPGYLRALDVTVARLPDRELSWPPRAGDPARTVIRTMSTPPEAALFAVVTDRLAWIGDPGTGRPLGVIAEPGPVAAAAFSPDGHWLYTAGRDGIRTWALTETEQARTEAGVIHGA